MKIFEKDPISTGTTLYSVPTPTVAALQTPARRSATDGQPMDLPVVDAADSLKSE